MTILVYGRKEPPCAHCKTAVDVLDSRGMDYEFVDLSRNPELLELFKMHHQTIPQIYENGKHKGDSSAAYFVGRDVEHNYNDVDKWEWHNECPYP